MKNLFGEGGILYRFLTKMTDLIILNLIFLLTCIPVVTIGASCTALYSLTLKMCKNEEAYIVRSYFRYFKENFRKGTLAWGICAAVILLFYVDFCILSRADPQIRTVLTTAVLAAALLCAMIMSYVFPLMAKFENTLSNTFKNALIISMTRIQYTIPVTAVNLVFVFVIFYGGVPMIYGIPVYILVGFAFSAYINSFFLGKVFEKYV